MSDNIANLDPAKVLRRTGMLYGVLSEGGLPWSAFQQPIDDPALRARLVKNWLAGVPEVTVPYGETPAKRAFEIVRTAYGPDLVTQLLGYTFGQGERKMLEVVPYPTDLLERHADTHILVPRHLAATMMSIKGVKVVRQKNLFWDQNWYHNEDLGCRPCGSGWMFLRKGKVHGTVNLPRSEQIRCLLLGERVPYGIEVTYATILHKLVTDEWLFSRWLRCQDIDSHGNRLNVGVLEGQLDVYCSWDDRPNPSIGLASAW
ncbi:hypothetical protein HY464_00530 [Candidatus Peregrinibacteria bacterium]|nr:hypothetical protein [Candidatus Peregrinibacteria bacterium]